MYVKSIDYVQIVRYIVDINNVQIVRKKGGTKHGIRAGDQIGEGEREAKEDGSELERTV